MLDGQLQDAIRQIGDRGNIVATISPEDVRKAGAKSTAQGDASSRYQTRGPLSPATRLVVTA